MLVLYLTTFCVFYQWYAAVIQFVISFVAEKPGFLKNDSTNGVDVTFIIVWKMSLFMLQKRIP